MNIVVVVIRNSLGQYFVHQRSTLEDTHPNFYALGIGGHAEPKEKIASAVQRELNEEISINEPVKFLFKMNMKNIGLNHAVHVHELIYNGQIKNCDEEWQWSGWMTEEEINKLVSENKLCPDTAEYYKKYKKIKTHKP